MLKRFRSAITGMFVRSTRNADQPATTIAETRSTRHAIPYAYACPAKCGCLWRDNLPLHGDRSSSLFGPNSRACRVCEPLPLARMIPLYL